jgi:hypothetical protein
LSDFIPKKKKLLRASFPKLPTVTEYTIAKVSVYLTTTARQPTFPVFFAKVNQGVCREKQTPNGVHSGFVSRRSALSLVSSPISGLSLLNLFTHLWRNHGCGSRRANLRHLS